MLWRRLAPLALLAVAGLGAAVLAQVDENAFLPERETTCWPCHVQWSPPLKSMYNIVPPESLDAKVGAPFDYTVRIENPWLADLTYVQPTLDLTKAPSLRFAAGREPSTSSASGVITPDPAAPTEPQSGFVVVEVPSPATSLVLTLAPADGSSNGPDLTLKVYPGVREPTGQPAVTVNEAGAGQPEVLELPSAADLAPLGYGNWTVEAETTFLSPGGPVLLPVSGPAFTATALADFLTDGLTSQSLSTREPIDNGGSRLFTWRLEATKLPAAEESVLVLVNGTAYYNHASASNDDEANFTKSLDVRLSTAGDQVQLAVAGNAGPSGVALERLSMARVSEVVGYVTAFLLLASVWSGGMFGKGSRRSLNSLFGSAKRRVAFHNVLSYGIMLFATIHLVLFIVETAFDWRIGLLLGGIGLLAMLLLGVTGAFQVGLIRRWNYAAWRWTHYGLAVAAIVFTLVHMFLDGANLERYVEALGWNDPLVPDRLESA